MERFLNILKGVVAISAIAVFGYFAGTLSDRFDQPEPNVTGTGEPDIGGAFELVDTEGEIFTDRDLLGRYSLIYFGYTHCPDVCPLDMNRISMALGMLEGKFEIRDQLQPVFITVDPARDTPEVLSLFLEGYHPSFIGLTGTQAQIEAAARVYKVYWEKILESEHQADGDDHQLFGHSSYIYLMDETGKYVAHFDTSFTASALAVDLLERLD